MSAGLPGLTQPGHGPVIPRNVTGLFQNTGGLPIGCPFLIRG